MDPIQPTTLIAPVTPLVGNTGIPPVEPFVISPQPVAEPIQTPVPPVAPASSFTPTPPMPEVQPAGNNAMPSSVPPVTPPQSIPQPVASTPAMPHSGSKKPWIIVVLVVVLLVAGVVGFMLFTQQKTPAPQAVAVPTPTLVPTTPSPTPITSVSEQDVQQIDVASSEADINSLDTSLQGL